MNRFNRHSKSTFVFFFALLSCLPVLTAQNGVQTNVSGEGKNTRLGVPQDWTHQHIVFNRNQLAQRPDLAAMEPRRLHQAIRRNESSLAYHEVAVPGQDRMVGAKKIGLARDWNVSLGVGAVAFGMSPAKYGFDESAPPSCEDDYAVFGLQVAGLTGGQANMIAFNNLYSGAGGLCGSGGPSVLFAYNTTTAIGGVISTSPVLSLDGTKIAFIESTATSSIFHVLTWASGAGNGTSAITAAFPGLGNTASMVSITYAPLATDTRSSPWVDYAHDEAYMGADDGKIYKITGVFLGTPTLAGAPWPATVASNLRLTAPVLDQFTRNLFMGDGQGGLRSINVDNPGVVKSLAVGLAGDFNPVIADGPIVDADNGTVFAVSANDGTSAVVVQADTTTLAKLSKARIGQGSSTNVSVNIYDGAFDNDYYTDPASGFLLVCGTGASDTTPWRYQFGFTGRVMRAATSSSGQMVASANTRCSPVTEYFNENINGGSEFFFWGLTANCTGAGTAGCIRIRTTSGVTANVNEAGGTSAIIIDNKSTAGQASSIYFSNQIAPRAAYKLAQTGQ